MSRPVVNEARDQEIAHAYSEEGLSRAEIARQYQLTPPRVSQILARLEVATRPPGRPQKPRGGSHDNLNPTAAAAENEARRRR